MSERETSKLPYVSVICPIYNGQHYVRILIESLLGQDYPQDLYEIIIVDNNSQDRTRQIVSEYPVTLLEERQSQSSYAARNKGIAQARGEILAFIDADCEAVAAWLKEGVKALLSSSAYLLGGKMEFVYSAQPTAAEMFDSIAHMDFETTIREDGTMATANLFVRAELFEKLGLFPQAVQSGGDIQWTGLASRKGYKLVYAEKAAVRHPTRQIKELLKKRYRTGTGVPYRQLGRGQSLGYVLLYMIYYILYVPIPWSQVRQSVQRRGTKEMHKNLYRMMGIGFLCNLVGRLGTLTEVFRILVGKGRRSKLRHFTVGGEKESK
ncbi:glycosyltransferase [Planctomycetota bacterium]